LHGIGARYGHLLEFLHHRTHFGFVARWRSRLVQDLALRRRKHTSDPVEELHGILGHPEVDVERVELVVVFVLVVRVIGWQMPFLVPLDLADGECYKASVFVRVTKVDPVEIWSMDAHQHMSL
jgi:hypothetical protein